MGAEPNTTAVRYNKKKRKHVQIKQPNVIKQYNKHMGGVDLADNMVANYRIGIRGKNWWWPIFSNYVDVSIINAWKLWRVVHPTESMSLLKFRREVSFNYLRASKSSHIPISTAPPSRFPIAASHPSGLTIEHFLQKLPDQKQLRCRQCYKQARFQCTTCKVSLHQHCIQLYHTNI